jgi:hypothetical protein
MTPFAGTLLFLFAALSALAQPTRPHRKEQP